jgi:hypothetical protein
MRMSAHGALHGVSSEGQADPVQEVARLRLEAEPFLVGVGDDAPVLVHHVRGMGCDV